MPLRDDASFIRPRLYDKDDPEKDDDVALILDGLESQLNQAMASGDKETVQHVADLKKRIVRAGDGYDDRLRAEDDDE